MKIGLTGTVSCGKTTLVNELSKLDEFKNYEFVTERSKYLRDLGIPLNTDSTLKGQTIFLAERVSELIQPNIITDRTILDVLAFTNSAKSINIHQKELFEQYASQFIPEYDYIFYVSPIGIDIEDNGVRCVDKEYRDLIDFKIRHLISRYNHKIKNVIFIPPNLNIEDRVKNIKNVLFK